ncbi:MAG: leucyl aminopeptidase [Hyphomicrobiales bacterium]|jgi:leucyl aminopeptidase
MSQLSFTFVAHAIEDDFRDLPEGPLVIFAKSAESFSGSAAMLDKAGEGALTTAAKASGFKAGWGETVILYALPGAPSAKTILVGANSDKAKDPEPHLNLGGKVASALSKATEATIVVDDMDADDAASILAGLKLGAYRFDRYKSLLEKDDENGEEDSSPPALAVTVLTTDKDALEAAFHEADAVASGTMLARDLVNEPPNILGPEEFAGVAQALDELGVKVTVLDDAAMRELGMGALLGVAQGSAKPARMAIMEWKGGANDKPVAIVGKGVVFDSGGISIKPSGGMEDMKGDMGGAACVVGLMHALAARNAKVNAVGVIGLVENMPDGNAQRPGDIVTSMAGKTIEIINTDAEGRLVLADALHYTRTTFEPKVMIDLATLTGAILVALGQEYAGLFSNDDDLATDLHEAGQRTGEKVWRLPIGPAYDKMINSRFADMKNTGGRFAGSITAAQFLQRFVGDTPWAHLDVAGAAMSAPKSDINQSFGSGFGVRLLNDYIRAVHEES